MRISDWSSDVCSSDLAAKYRSTMERGLVMMGRQDRAQRADGVDRCGKPRIQRHLDDDLDDLRAGRTDIERRGKMHFQLRAGIPHHRQGGDRRQLSRFQIKPRSAVDVAKAELDRKSTRLNSSH